MADIVVYVGLPWSCQEWRDRTGHDGLPWADGADPKAFGLTIDQVKILNDLYHEVSELEGQALIHRLRFPEKHMQPAKEILYAYIKRVWEKEWHIQSECREVMAAMDLTVGALVREAENISELADEV